MWAWAGEQGKASGGGAPVSILCSCAVVCCALTLKVDVDLSDVLAPDGGDQLTHRDDEGRVDGRGKGGVKIGEREEGRSCARGGSQRVGGGLHRLRGFLKGDYGGGGGWRR